MEIYKFTINLIKEAGELLLQNYDASYEIMVKNSNPRDLVTDIDYKINDFLVGQIRSAFPEHEIYSEEGDSSNMPIGEGYVWVLDPIDGTANFSKRIPHFAVSVGLLSKGVPVVGAIYNPITRELFGFEKGKGSWFNDRKIHVSKVDDLGQGAVFMISGRKPEFWDWGSGVYRKLLTTTNKTRIFGCSGLDLCFVADGRIEGMIYGQLTTIDIAAAIGILIEAGGKVTDGNGQAVKISKSPQKAVASNGTIIHEKLLEIAA